MKSSDNVSVTFVNSVVGRGILNGIVNLSFAVFNFTPSDDGKSVEVDPTIACRLRMDKTCAVQLREVLSKLIADVEEAEQNIAMGISNEAPADGVIPKRAEKTH